MVNFGIFTHKHPCWSIWESSLVAVFSNLTWEREHPLVANCGNLAKEQTKVVDLSSPLVADFCNFA